MVAGTTGEDTKLKRSSIHLLIHKENSMKTPRELQTRFPYMFQGEHLGIGICKGWFPIFSKLCQEIDVLLGENKQGFHWVQVKEKFGTARFYWELDGVDTPLRIDIMTSDGLLSFAARRSGEDQASNSTRMIEQLGKLAVAAEYATARLCAACGEPGFLNSGEYFLTLCPLHAAQYEDPARKDLDMWFGAGDNFISDGRGRSDSST